MISLDAIDVVSIFPFDGKCGFFFGFACIMCWVMHMFDPWQRRILLEKQSGNQVTQIAE